MVLPRPPISANTPIPNQPFSADEVYYLEGNQGRLPLGNGLFINPETGAFTDIEPSPYIYCVPQYSNLPVTYPPYGCETEVNTAGVTDFTGAWGGCETITDFPCLDTLSASSFSYAWSSCYYMSSFPPIYSRGVTNFEAAWEYCYALTEFPLIDTRSGTSFYCSWVYCTGLTSFPSLDFGRGINFYGTWNGCYSLTEFPYVDVSRGENFAYSWFNCPAIEDFPSLNFESGTNFRRTWQACFSLTSFPFVDVSRGTDFTGCWEECLSLTSFPAGMFDSCGATDFDYAWYSCALSQQSVDNILVSLDTAGQEYGIVRLDGGTSSTPGTAGLAARFSLEGKGWTVTTN